MTNICDIGNRSAQNNHIIQTSEPNACDSEQQVDSKIVFHNPDSDIPRSDTATFVANRPDTPVNIPKPKIRLTRNPPSLDTNTWDKYDKEFESINETEWNRLKKGKVTPEQFVSNLNSSLASFLESKEEFQEESKNFFQHNKPNKDYLEKIRLLKINLNKESKLPNATEEDIALAKEAVRTHRHVLKTRRGSPVDDRPSTDKLQYFVQKKKNKKK